MLRVRDQMYDTMRAHSKMSKAQMRQRSLELLRHVQLDPERVIDAYPHELSGGMRQRVLLAMSLLLNPQIIIFDEPTTALDILTQRTILDLLKALKADLGFSMMFISHDLSVIHEISDRVVVLQQGRLVESGPAGAVFASPREQYTKDLLAAIPRLDGTFLDDGNAA